MLGGHMEYSSYLHQPGSESGSSNSASSFTVYSATMKSTGPAPGTACDQCHRCKVRCSGQIPSCERCARYHNACTYSLGKPLGKPKGRKRNATKHTFRQHTSNNATKEGSRESSRMSDEPIECSRNRSNRPSPFTGTEEHIPSETLFEPGTINSDTLDFFNNNDFEASIGSTSFPVDMFTEFDMSNFNQRPVKNTADNQHDHSPLALRNGNPPLSNKKDSQQQLDSRIPRSTASLISSRPSSARADFENADSPRETGGHLLLQVITQLHNQQQSVAWAPINSTLTIARQGLDAVSRYVSSVPCTSAPVAASPSLIIACLLILQLSLSCYIELGPHAAKRFEQNGLGQQANTETLCVGGFTIEDSESCRSVLDALVCAERKRGQTILVRLRHVARELKGVGEDKTGFLELLLGGEQSLSRANSYHSLAE